jgi:DNA polymerase V
MCSPVEINKILFCAITEPCPIPFFNMKVQAGAPAAVDNPTFIKLDINKHLIKNPNTTFFVQVTGESMVDAGIYENDLLIVDKFIEPNNNNIVIAVINSKFTIRRLKIDNTGIFLVAENTPISSIEVNEDCYICGVVTSVVRQL